MYENFALPLRSETLVLIMNENKERTNPFFLPYNTPHDTAPFDRIRMEDYEEAMLEGIRREDEQIDKIVNNPAKPTFDNTIISVDDGKDGEDYYNLLDRVSTVFFNLLSAETNDEMDALAQKMSPILTKHSNDIRLNEKLFERIKYVHRHHRKLSPEEKMLLDNCYDGFVRNGALLDAAGKERLRQLTEEISVLGLQFSQNLLKENKAFTLHLTDEAQLDGLPETAREAAALAAKEQGKEGWVFTLDFPSYLPFMTYSTQRELRRQLYMAKNTECIHDNTENNLEICKRIINLRRELAQLLGHNSYADYVLKHRMAGNVRNVYKLFNDLIKAYKPTAQKEVAAIEKMARQLEGKDFKLEPWDFGFYSHKLQLQKFNIDAEMLRPYFELSKVIDGVFGLANRLYGITFKENKDIPVYHPDVKAYEVFDEDGSYLAVFYADFHPRKGKQGGAWMTSYQGQWMECEDMKKPFGPGNIKNVRPHVSVMFANTRFESLSGTSVWWDFVELPSQFMENFAIEKEFLRTFAFHYKTGEPIPDDLIGRIVKSRNYNVAYTCMRQVGFGLLDMAYYTKKDEFTDDIIPFEKNAWEKAQILPQLPDTCMTVQFSHIMAGGYAAGYYSYKWAEVLDADAFAVFKKHGVFDKKTARSFRENILSKGGTENPMTLYKRFKGGEPTIDALLKRNGIKTTKTR